MIAQTAWEELLRIALLGTERQNAGLPAPAGRLGETLAVLKASDREGAVLSASAAVALYLRAGRLPQRASVEERSADATLGAKDLPRIGPRSAGHLALMLAGTHLEVLPEWLAACTAAGKRVPEERLPALLDLGGEQDALRKAIRKVLGLRGQWLAQQNEAWHWAITEAAVDEKGFLLAWQTAGTAQRLGFVFGLREKNPALARAAVQSTWKEDSAEERASALELFETGLSMNDEPFLEECLDDRRKEIRQAALGLLLRLPDSRLRARAVQRVRPLLAVKGLLKKVLEVAPPSACGQEMQRDGIETKGAAGVKMGEKAFLLLQVLGQVPPSFWSKTLQQPPATLLKWAAATDWEAALRLGWTAAASAFRDSEWIEALMDASPLKEEKLTAHTPETLAAALTPESFARIFRQKLKENGGRLAGKKGGEGLAGLLQGSPRPWTAALAREVLKALKLETQGETHWGLAAVLRVFPRAIPAEVLAEALEGWPVEGKYWNDWKESVDELLSVVQFRHDMLKAINES
ncbi:MAG: hypothetical protein HY291_19715 [Planctomycetes bacterium]|nr:hypothetical protein [Planctomycetota bacterium]